MIFDFVAVISAISMLLGLTEHLTNWQITLTWFVLFGYLVGRMVLIIFKAIVFYSKNKDDIKSLVKKAKE